MILALTLLVLLAVATLVTHEVGHLLAGLVSGFRMDGFYLGPFAIERTEGKLRMQWQRSLALAGGAIQLNPTRLHGLRRRLMVVFLGGPLISLSVGLTTFSTSLFIEDDIFTRSLLETFGVLNLGIGLVTLIPVFASPNLPTDGLRIRRLIRGGKDADQHVALAIAGGLILSGRGPQEWSESWVSTLDGYVKQYDDLIRDPAIAYATFLMAAAEGMISELVGRWTRPREASMGSGSLERSTPAADCWLGSVEKPTERKRSFNRP